jgi:hypothetical protein
VRPMHSGYVLATPCIETGMRFEPITESLKTGADVLISKSQDAAPELGALPATGLNAGLRPRQAVTGIWGPRSGVPSLPSR